MPSRELQYRVTIDTGVARRQASAIRRAIESELRQISIGQINTSGLTAATEQVRALRSELDKAADEQERLNKAGNTKRSTGAAGSALIGGIAGYITVSVAKQAEATARSFAQGNTEIKRANVAFRELAGGVQQAEARLIAIQQGAAGAVSQLGAIQIANQAASLGLANTAGEFKRLTEAARVTALISPVINDIGSAITELGLASANLSFRRLDQLGLSVTEVKDRMRDLQNANSELEDSQAFLAASVDALIAKGGNLINSQAAQASGVERFNVAINEFLDQEGAFSNALESVYGGLAEAINKILVLSNFGSDKSFTDFVGEQLENLKQERKLFSEEIRAIEEQGGIGGEVFGVKINLGPDFTGTKDRFKELRGEIDKAIPAYTALDAAFQSANNDIISGVDGALQYRSALRQITVELERGSIGYEDISGRIREANNEYKSFQDAIAATRGADDILTRGTSAAYEAQKAADERLAFILEGQKSINDGISSRAQKSVATVGAEQALANLQEQKKLVDQAIEKLIASSVVDTDELTFRLAEIDAQVDQFFADLSTKQPESFEINFGGIGDALAQFDQPFVDFLPSLDAMRDRLVELQNEIAFAGGATREQADELSYLATAASVAGGEAAALDAITNELGTSFLYQNEAAAATLDAMYQAAIAYQAGEISAAQLGGVVDALGGQLIAYASQAGVATSATLAFVNSLSGFAGTPGFQVGTLRGGSIAQRIDTQKQERERRAALAEAERLQKEAARDQERAAKAAGKSLEDAAKKAARELEGALRNVPGLFGRTQVTERDFKLTEAGVYLDQADEYLRRLQAEVEQGKDIFDDVSIEEARQALQDLGITVASDSKVAFEQFAEAWESSVLFSNADNIAKFIDSEAVQRSLDLQEKAKQGQENIFKAFGVAIDGAAESAISGIQSAGASATASLPTTSALIPMPTIEQPTVDLNSLVGQWLSSQPAVQAVQGPQDIPTLGGVSTVLDVEAIQGQLDTIKFTPEIDLSELDADIAIGTTLDAESFAATLAKITSTKAKVTVSTGLDIQSFGDTVTKMQSTRATVKVSTDLNVESFAATLEKVGSTKQTIGIAPTLAGDVGTLVDPLAIQIADRLKSAIATQIGATQFDGSVVTPIADGLLRAINTEFSVRGGALGDEGNKVAESIKTSLASAIGTTQWTDDGAVTPIADGLITAINTQVRASASAIGREGSGVAQLIQAGITEQIASISWVDGEAVTPIATGLITAINTQVRANLEGFRREGMTIAPHILAGLSSGFNETDSNGNATNGIATSLLTATSTQLSATQNLFYGVGQIPVASLLGGFKSGFSGDNSASLATPMLDGLSTGIRAKQADFMQRGATIAQAVQAGFTGQFNTDSFKNTLMAVGESMYVYLEAGILSAASGGGLAEALGAQILADIAETVEAPTQ